MHFLSSEFQYDRCYTSFWLYHLGLITFPPSNGDAFVLTNEIEEETHLFQMGKKQKKCIGRPPLASDSFPT